MDRLSQKATQESPRLGNVPIAPYPELPSVLGELVAGIQNELVKNLIGVYLVGSLATGDFDLDSDVDFLVVTNDELTDEVVRSLQAMHTRIYSLDCYPAQHLEGSYINHRLLNQSETVGMQPLWYLDNGSTTFERSVHDNQWHVRWVLRERGVVLVGPEATSLLGPIPVEALRAETSAAMRRDAKLFGAEIDQPLSFWNTRFGQSFAVLHYCRMLHMLKTGTVQSKLAGMKWSRQILDPKWASLIQRAWEEREGVRHLIKIRQRADSQVLRETFEFIKYAVRQSER
jgi:streptomycin 3"-adenylyltransferase